VTLLLLVVVAVVEDEAVQERRGWRREDLLGSLGGADICVNCAASKCIVVA
jgi:hypothetical protein